MSFDNYNKHRTKNRLSKICLRCKNQFFPSHHFRKFCSRKCFLESKQIERTTRLENHQTLDSRQYRKRLIEQFGAKCMKCGWSEINTITGKCPIELDHIDGNSLNNEFSNLRLLCPNCHSLTPTYKALNKGNGRSKRTLLSKHKR